MRERIVPDAKNDKRTAMAALERRRQLRGSFWLIAAVLLFSVWRAGIHRVFTLGWWRLW